MRELNELLAIINNALLHKHENCFIKKTKASKELVKCLLTLGYVKTVQERGKQY